MYTKYTITSPRANELLENLIVKHGQIVTVQQIYAEAAALMNREQTEYLIGTLTKHGWLMRIKKGLYSISDLSTRGFLSLSPYIIANLLVKDSYVSFAAALHHHGMFDQLTNKVVSVSLKMYKTVKLENIDYTFVKTKADYYFGWQEVSLYNQTVRIATAEKALVDIMNFHRNIYAVDLVLEKLREHKNDLNLTLLNEYIGEFSMTTIKNFGFVFDLLGIDSSALLKLAKKTDGAHRMIASAKKFNAKWRLYHDSYFDKYKSP